MMILTAVLRVASCQMTMADSLRLVNGTVTWDYGLDKLVQCTVVVVTYTASAASHPSASNLRCAHNGCAWSRLIMVAMTVAVWHLITC